MQLSPEEELEVRSCLAAIETEERKKELKKKEKELKEKEEKLVLKATEIRNATIEAKRVAAQLQLMAGQLGRLANQILAETKKYICTGFQLAGTPSTQHSKHSSPPCTSISPHHPQNLLAQGSTLFCNLSDKLLKKIFIVIQKARYRK